MSEYEVTFRTSVPNERQEDFIVDELDGFVGGHGSVALVTLSCESTRGARLTAQELANALFDTDLLVHRIEADLVSAATIANRTGKTRAAVGMWARGARRDGSAPFPAPAVLGSTQLWRWQEVNVWLAANGMAHDEVTYLTVEDETWVDYHIQMKRRTHAQLGSWSVSSRPATSVKSGWETAATFTGQLAAPVVRDHEGIELR